MADPLRAHLSRILDWEEAHVGFEKAVEGITRDQRGAVAPGFEHSAWQLVEHLRLAQHDLLDFCVNSRYSHALTWPDDYWPTSPAPPDDAAWDAAIASFKRERQALKALAEDESIDLFALVPTGQKQQTYFRCIVLVADHNSYHVGQLVAVRKALGIWH